MRKILILNGAGKRNGNTAALIKSNNNSPISCTIGSAQNASFSGTSDCNPSNCSKSCPDLLPNGSSPAWMRAIFLVK
jgi:hypothetical protein